MNYHDKQCYFNVESVAEDSLAVLFLLCFFFRSDLFSQLKFWIFLVF